jgi:ABC-type long-subunit fatty acid transport system fused permease/ATPase subunit
MELIRPMALGGLVVMACAAVATAIWPVVASVVFGVLVAVLSAVAGVLTGLALRWARAELAWRRELRTMPEGDGATSGSAAVVPTLAELRESA